MPHNPIKQLSLSFLAASTILGAPGLAAAQEQAPADTAANMAPVTPININDACRTTNSARSNFLFFSRSRSSEQLDEQCRQDLLLIEMLRSDNPQIRTLAAGEYLRRSPAAQETINELAAREYAIQNLPALIMTIEATSAAGAATVTCRQVANTIGDVVFDCSSAAPTATDPATMSSDTSPPVVVMAAPGGMR